MPLTPSASRLLWDLPKSSPTTYVELDGTGARGFIVKTKEHRCDSPQSFNDCKHRDAAAIACLPGFLMRFWRVSLCVKRTSIGKFREWIHYNITSAARLSARDHFKQKRQRVSVPVHWYFPPFLWQLEIASISEWLNWFRWSLALDHLLWES